MLTQSVQAASTDIYCRTVNVAGVEIFYREAGNPTQPTILLLPFWKERTPQTEARLKELFELPATKRQYLKGAPDSSLVSPDSWEHAQWGMDRPGDKEIQFASHANYGSNIECYEEWHAIFASFSRPP